MEGGDVGGHGEGDDGSLQASHREVDMGEGRGGDGEGLVLWWEEFVEGGVLGGGAVEVEGEPRKGWFRFVGGVSGRWRRCD